MSTETDQVFTGAGEQLDPFFIDDAAEPNASITVDKENSEEHEVAASETSSVSSSEFDEEEWAEVSKGRYFGSDPKDDIICHNCKGHGHVSRDCTHTLCTTCGAIDDHPPHRCPRTKRCMNCGLLGHIQSKCPEPRNRSRVCRTCNIDTHTSRTCPLIWRYYVETEDTVRVEAGRVKKHCYNCAAEGHFGDDCDLPSRSQYQSNTAFCEANCPTGNDVSNEEFTKKLHQEFKDDSHYRPSSSYSQSNNNNKYSKRPHKRSYSSGYNSYNSDRKRRDNYSPYSDGRDKSLRNRISSPSSPAESSKRRKTWRKRW
ncbi:zinc knuckle TRAMP complex subunit Air1 [Schizosaccharomyces japonicus yFS275]|uniref:Zinc knuckle TRAMP complex subunit Air1 n=1 Tax=Schizosaccharomyces japonicus (strain yFS275 / FY16936) TaxID=402676 RepID=B6K5K9_SCHJY|nr:zinc knuckle TRAMP complex subunit Air1 [Schizosaccharomyces japonicus yFS275]EEB08813.1 zinc knuckle TRAMP complex subunit Air1 [Schizosaccharomyces japonicus yFS275]